MSEYEGMYNNRGKANNQKKKGTTSNSVKKKKQKQIELAEDPHIARIKRLTQPGNNDNSNKDKSCCPGHKPKQASMPSDAGSHNPYKSNDTVSNDLSSQAPINTSLQETPELSINTSSSGTNTAEAGMDVTPTAEEDTLDYHLPITITKEKITEWQETNSYYNDHKDYAGRIVSVANIVGNTFAEHGIPGSDILTMFNNGPFSNENLNNAITEVFAGGPTSTAMGNLVSIPVIKFSDAVQINFLGSLGSSNFNKETTNYTLVERMSYTQYGGGNSNNTGKNGGTQLPPDDSFVHSSELFSDSSTDVSDNTNWFAGLGAEYTNGGFFAGLFAGYGQFDGNNFGAGGGAVGFEW